MLWLSDRTGCFLCHLIIYITMDNSRLSQNAALEVAPSVVTADELLRLEDVNSSYGFVMDEVCSSSTGDLPVAPSAVADNEPLGLSPVNSVHNDSALVANELSVIEDVNNINSSAPLSPVVAVENILDFGVATKGNIVYSSTPIESSVVSRIGTVTKDPLLSIDDDALTLSPSPDREHSTGLKDNSSKLWKIASDIGCSFDSPSRHVLACGGDYSTRLKKSIWAAISELPPDLNISSHGSSRSALVSEDGVSQSSIQPPISPTVTSRRRHSVDSVPIWSGRSDINLSCSADNSGRLSDTCLQIKTNLEKLRCLRKTTEAILVRSKEISADLTTTCSLLGDPALDPRKQSSISVPSIDHSAQKDAEPLCSEHIKSLIPFLDRIEGRPFVFVITFNRPPFVLYADEVIGSATVSLPSTSPICCEVQGCTFKSEVQSFSKVLNQVLDHYVDKHFFSIAGTNFFCGLCKLSIVEDYLTHSCYFTSPPVDIVQAVPPPAAHCVQTLELASCAPACLDDISSDSAVLVVGPVSVTSASNRNLDTDTSAILDDPSILSLCVVDETLPLCSPSDSGSEAAIEDFIVREDSSLLKNELIPANRESSPSYGETWASHANRDCFHEGLLLHASFPRNNTLNCDVKGCSYLAHGFTWDLTLSAMVHHLEINHACMIIECIRWCLECRKRFRGHPSAHSCLQARKRWYVPIKTPIPWTCYLCDFSSVDRTVLQDHLQVAHLLPSPSAQPKNLPHPKVPLIEVVTPVASTHSVTSPPEIVPAPTENVPQHKPVATSTDITPSSDLQSQLVTESANAPVVSPSSVIACVSRDDILISNELAILPLPLDNPLKCPFPDCNVQLTATVWTARKASLFRHIRNKHAVAPAEIKHLCTICGNFTGRLPSAHSCLSENLDSRPMAFGLQLKCEFCSFTTVNHFALSNHLRAHKSKKFKRTFQELTADLPTDFVATTSSSPVPHRTDSAENFQSLPSEPSVPSASLNLDENIEDPAPVDSTDADSPSTLDQVPHAINENAPPLVTKYYHIFHDFFTCAPTDPNWARFQEKLVEFTMDIRSTLNIKEYNSSSSSSQPGQLNLGDASAVQRAFRRNRRQTMRVINKEKRTPLNFPDEDVFTYFSDIWNQKPHDDTLLSEIKKHRPLPMHNFSYLEVKKILYSCENTSPGRDKVTYENLKQIDPEALILTCILNVCMKFSRIPDVWRDNLTVLIPKKEDPRSPAQTRPITLLPTMYKLLTKCLVKRITSWIVQHKVLSPSQKGFLPADGVFEHNFVLERIIRLTKETSADLFVAWLDVEAAFSSIPHSAVFSALKKYGLGTRFCQLIEDIYRNNVTSFIGTSNPSRSVQVNSGVRQGCPLSGLLFALTIDPVLRKLSAPDASFGHSSLAYADDIVLISTSAQDLQTRIHLASTLLNQLSLKLNPSKVSTIHLSGRVPVGTRDTKFTLNDVELSSISEGSFFTNLGRPFSVPNLVNPNDIKTFLDIADNISKSYLSPWQKLQAFRDFLFPSLSFGLRNCQFPKGELKKLDKLINSETKKILNLHAQRAPPSYIHGSRASGCVGFPSFCSDYDVACLDGVFKLLTSPDDLIRKAAFEDLFELTHHRIKREPTLSDAAIFLNGSMDNDYKFTTNKHQCLWTLARKASRRLNVSWSFSADHLPIISYNGQTFNVKDRSRIMKIFRAVEKTTASTSLQNSTAFGRFSECVAADPASSHFLFSGDYTTFSDWRFIHRARLGQLPLKGCRPWISDTNLRLCRQCSDERIESTPHVMHHCMKHSRAYTHRHNTIVNRILNIAQRDWNVYAADFPIGQTSLRPDLVLIRGNSALVLDITIVGENKISSFEAARTFKKEHYAPVVEHLKHFYKTVNVDAIILGGLGTWDPRNDSILLKMCSKKYLSTLKKLCVSDVIGWSRKIFNEHISGLRHYTEADIPALPRLSSLPCRASTSSAPPAPTLRDPSRYPTYSYSDAVKSANQQPSHLATSSGMSSVPGCANTPSLASTSRNPIPPSSEDSLQVPAPCQPRVTFAEPLSKTKYFCKDDILISECHQPTCHDVRKIVHSSAALDSPSSPDIVAPPLQDSRIDRPVPQQSGLQSAPLPPRLRNDPGILKRLGDL